MRRYRAYVAVTFSGWYGQAGGLPCCQAAHLTREAAAACGVRLVRRLTARKPYPLELTMQVNAVTR